MAFHSLGCSGLQQQLSCTTLKGTEAPRYVAGSTQDLWVLYMMYQGWPSWGRAQTLSVTQFAVTVLAEALQQHPTTPAASPVLCWSSTCKMQLSEVFVQETSHILSLLPGPLVPHAWLEAPTTCTCAGLGLS